MHLKYAIYNMQNILHARIVCVYFGFKSMASYVEDGREVSKIIYV